MKERRKDEAAIDKIGWYYRHWQSMGFDKENTSSYI